MGRQHTTWINEANWKKLDNIPGNSTSSKIGYAIEHVDPDHQMWVNAKLRQLETAKKALREIAHRVHDVNLQDHNHCTGVLLMINSIVDDNEWLWEASA